jgi:hypothetical protein
MKLYSGNKKSLYALVALTLGLGYSFYANVIASGPAASPATRTTTPPSAAALPAVKAPAADDSAAPAPSRANRNRSGEFHPIVHAKRPEDRVVTTDVDPTLHLDLLAKLEAVPAAGDGRNLFAIGAVVQKPKGDEIKVKPNPGTTFSGPSGQGPLVTSQVEPPPPPITFKYYGFSTTRKDGRRAAFFLENDIILIKSEGDMVVGSYKLVRIERTTAVVEDVKSKRQQTVVLAEEAQQV